MLAFLFLYRAQRAQEADRLSPTSSRQREVLITLRFLSSSLSKQGVTHSIQTKVGPEGHEFFSVTIAAARDTHSAWRRAAQALTLCV